MKEIHDAIRNAAKQLANAKTLEDAQSWQGIITNLTSTLQIVGEDDKVEYVGTVTETKPSKTSQTKGG